MDIDSDPSNFIFPDRYDFTPDCGYDLALFGVDPNLVPPSIFELKPLNHTYDPIIKQPFIEMCGYPKDSFDTSGGDPLKRMVGSLFELSEDKRLIFYTSMMTTSG